MCALIKTVSRGACVVAATIALGFMAIAATAQQAGAPAAKAQPAPAAKAPTTAPAAKAVTSAKTATASVCKGLDQTACGANPTCLWIEPKKEVSKSGAALKAYCKTKPKEKVAKKAAASDTAPKKK